MALRKRSQESPPQGVPHATADIVFPPALSELKQHMVCTRYPDSKEPRETTTLTLFTDQGTLKYFINDNFLNFWFRFIFRNRSAVETGNYAYLREVIDRDYATWSGLMLERYFHGLFAESGNYNAIGSYWEKGNQNEIDLVAVNELKKNITVAEIKMNKARINMDALKKKGERLLESYQGYEVTWLALGLEDAADYL